MTTERKGELFTIAGGTIWAFFPIITILSMANVPSLLALAYATGFSCIFFLTVFVFKKRFKELLKPIVWKYSLFVVFFTGVLFYGLFFYGLTKTTSGNAALVGLFETCTSFLLFSIIRKEHFKREYRI